MRLPNRELLEELSKLAEHLDEIRLETLSQGLGLGKQRVLVKDRLTEPQPDQITPMIAAQPRPPQPQPQPQAASPSRHRPSPLRRATAGVARFVARFAIDILAALASSGVAWGLLTMVVAREHLSFDAKILLAWLPFQQGPAAEIYLYLGLGAGIFLAYLGFFRIFLGKSLGSYLYPSPNSKKAKITAS